MDGHEYESLVSSLVTTLVQNTPLRGHEIGTGRQNRIAGASGYRHQIDLTLRHQHSLFLVETKHWTRSVGVGAILVLASRVEDIRKQLPSTAVQASIVSTKHATRGAKPLAAHFEIKIDVVSSIKEYALQFADQLFIGMHERATATDISDAEVVRAVRG